MTKPRDAWMPLYVADYLADTGRLTTEGHGAYLLLLMDYWRNGPPPDDDETLGAITKLPPARWAKIKPVLSGFFTIEGGAWHQKRADEELAKAGRITDSRSAAGKVGATRRWGQRDSKPDGNPDDDGGGKRNGAATAKPMANAMAKPKQNDAPSPSQSPAAAAPDSSGSPRDPPTAAPPPAASPLAHSPGSAAEAQKRMEIGAKVLDAAGIDQARWVGNFALISAWLSANYDPELDILPAVRQCAARPGYTPPRSLGYFTAAIEEHWRQRALDIPAELRRPQPDRAPKPLRERRWERAVTRWIDGGCQGDKPKLEDFNDEPKPEAA